MHGRLHRWFCCALAQGIRRTEVDFPNEGGWDVGDENEKNKYLAKFMEVFGDFFGKVIVTD